MRLIALGDTHGRDDWKVIVAKEEFDKVVFIGDYFDTHEGITAVQQIGNFKDIIAYKRAEPEKVVLLIGNHDFHYLPTSKHRYSGFQELHRVDIQELLVDALKDDLMQMCYKEEQTLFTHAGITKTWFKANDLNESEVSLSINELFKHKPNSFEFTYGMSADATGDDISQTPIWVRPRSLYEDGLDDVVQVVGHTMQQRIVSTGDHIFIDTLGTSGEYLKMVDGSIMVGKLKS